MSNESVLVYDDNQIVAIAESFFNGNKDLSMLFVELLNYARSINPRLTLRLNKDIIGVSEPGVAFVFYATDSEGSFYIKFKSCKKKEEFVIDRATEYKSFCNESIDLVSNNPQYVIKGSQKDNAVERNTEKKYVVVNDREINESRYINDGPAINSIEAEIDRTLELCSDFLLNCDLKIADVFTDNRVSNALNRRGIIMCSQLTEVSGTDLAKTKCLGRRSLKYILDVCNELLASDHLVSHADKQPIAPEPPQKKNIWEELQSRTLSSFLSWLSKPTEKIEGLDDTLAYHLTKLEELFSLAISEDDHLNDRQKNVLIERTIKGIKLETIGEEYGVTRERIRQIVERASKRLNGKIYRGVYSEAFYSDYNDIFKNIDIDCYPQFIAYVRKKSKYFWAWIRRTLMEDTERLDMFIDLIEQKGECIYEYKTRTRLPELIRELRKMDEYDTAIEMAKQYTKKFGRSIYSDLLFIEIAYTYAYKDDNATALKFAAYVSDKDQREYHKLMQIITS